MNKEKAPDLTVEEESELFRKDPNGFINWNIQIGIDKEVLPADFEITEEARNTLLAEWFVVREGERNQRDIMLTVVNFLNGYYWGTKHGKVV